MSEVNASLLRQMPRFKSEYALIPFQQGLLVDGAKGVIVLKGAAIHNVLPRLLPLLDGKTHVSQVKRHLTTVPAVDIDKILSLLSFNGLVDEGAKLEEELTREDSSTLSYLRRFCSEKSDRDSGAKAFDRLRNVELLIVAGTDDIQLAECFSTALRQNGFLQVDILDRASLVFSPASPKSRLYIVLSNTIGDDTWIREFDRWCQQTKADWLRLAFDSSSGCADVGPLFSPNHSACFQCFCSTHAKRKKEAAAISVSRDPVAVQIWAGLAATGLTHYYAQIGQFLNGISFRRYKLADWSSIGLMTPRLPGCIHFAASSSKSSIGRVYTSHLFDEYVRARLENRVERDDWLNQSDLISFATHTPDKILRSIVLPHLDHLEQFVDKSANSLNENRAPVSLLDLAVLLPVAAGYRGAPSVRRLPKRWSATAGNLGSVELLVFPSQIEQLPPGLYTYQAQTHSLSVGPPTMREESLIDSVHAMFPDWVFAAPNIIVTFTGRLSLLARKYGNFAYRLVQLDAGVSMSQLTIVAEALGLGCLIAEPPPELSSKIENRLDDVTMFVVVSHRLAGTRCTLYERTCRETKESAMTLTDFSVPVSEYSQVTFEAVTAQLLKELQQVPATKPDLLDRPTITNHSHSCKTARAKAKPLSVGRLLDNRRSVRAFTKSSVTFQQLSFILNFVSEADTLAGHAATSDGSPIGLIAILRNFGGDQGTLYGYDPDTSSLRESKDIDLPAALQDIYLQTEFAVAPGHIFVFGNLEVACQRHGARGQRSLLRRTGFAIHRVSMAAAECGLSGTIVAGLRPLALSTHCGLDGYQKSCAVGYAFGYEISQEIGHLAQF
jgi:SagB-type dehydrogenase family enzyme